MTTKYVKHGDVREVTNSTGAKINSGDVVEFGAMVGVAETDIENTESGSVRFIGEFDSLPKVSGTAWTAGDSLDWDSSEGAFTKLNGTTAAGDIEFAAIAGADAAAGDTEGTVVLNRAHGTVT